MTKIMKVLKGIIIVHEDNTSGKRWKMYELEDKLEIKLIKSLNLDDNIVRNLEYIGLKHVSKLIQTH